MPSLSKRSRERKSAGSPAAVETGQRKGGSALVEDLVRSLDKLRVPTAEQRALLGLLGGQVVGQ